MDYLEDKVFVAFDTETTGLSHDAEVVGFSVSADIELGYYVVLKRWDKVNATLNEVIPAEVGSLVLEMLTTKKLIMHNGVFDCAKVCYNFNIDLMPSLHTDTLILGHLLNENRPNGLKELGSFLYGENAKAEQAAMKESIKANGGVITKEKYELYKADAELIGHYGAKDAILTLKLFYDLVPQLFDEGLDKFFYDDESMPLLRGPTYEMNNAGLRVDSEKLQKLKGTIEAECLELKAYIYDQITPSVKDKYPGTNKRNTFNIGSSEQLSWLLYHVLKNEFHTLTDTGREICKALDLKLPYAPATKRAFIETVLLNQGQVYNDAGKRIGAPWKYLKCDKEALDKLAPKYKWVAKLLEYSKAQKILKTYVIGIQERITYGIIRPSFLQHGTTSGRYSSRNPNFQNLPRNDKRIKDCIVARPGMVFVGADYSQLEPRVFASQSKDEKLLACFASGEDFYSVIGAEVFNRKNCSLIKDADDSFASLYPKERDIAKVVALSSTYGTTAAKMAPAIKRPIGEAQEVIDKYFDSFPSVYLFMLESHEQAKSQGYVTNLFGRKRRMPEALEIKKVYGNSAHDELPYNIRNILNLAVNHRVQSTGASIVNRASIEFHRKIKSEGLQAQIVLQVHDEIVVECPKEDAQTVAMYLKVAMEKAVELPGVNLEAIPKIGKTLAELK